MFVWAVFFSFVTKRVLLAAVLGVAAASIGAHLAVAIVTTQGHAGTYVDALPWRMVIAAGVALADVWLAARWFREKRDRQPKFVPAMAAETPREAIAFGRQFQRPQRAGDPRPADLAALAAIARDVAGDARLDRAAAGNLDGLAAACARIPALVH